MTEETKPKCKMEVFPKKYPYFILHGDNIIKSHNLLRVGAIMVSMKDGTEKKHFIVEDQYSATRYSDLSCAMEHFKENVRIDKEIKKEVAEGRL